MDGELTIQWFPGHMAKARRMIREDSALVDAVCEIIDARIPASSRNPELPELTAGKPRMVILNRVDEADPAATARWRAVIAREGCPVLETDCKSGRGVNAFTGAVRSLLRERIALYESRGQGGKPLRVMVAGIPNVGKSSFINRVARRRAAEAGDRPGVTRGKQWISAGGGVGNGVELLDTPGLLWPRFEDKAVGENLAFTGAVRDEILDAEALGARLMTRLAALYPDRLLQRYKLTDVETKTGDQMLAEAARRRGFLVSGGEVDTERMAAVLLGEYHEGRLGRLSLEEPDDGALEPGK